MPWPREAIDQGVDRRFAEMARRFPGSPAIVDPAGIWTYAALDERAQAVAARFASLETGDLRVGVLAHPGGALAAGMLGSLMAGGAFVPLEPGHPVARLAAIAADAGLAHVLVGDDLAELARLAFPSNLPTSSLATHPADAAPTRERRSAARIERGRPEDPAYLLYTSGSTGAPKGVVHSNRDHLHDMRVYTNALRIAPSDRLLLAARPAFRAGVMDLFAGLLTGATVVAVDLPEAGFSGLRNAIADHRVTVLHATPTVLRELVATLEPRERLADVRVAVLGGEALLATDLERIQAHLPAGAVIVNTLGSTEALIALQHFVAPGTTIEGPTVPVGHPVEDTEVLLLDSAGAPTATEGEIAVRSRHVARGYWQRPDLAAGSFEIDPEDPEIATYRTGDLGRVGEDGAIVFLGRADRQVKIRGVRVEVEEVEQALARMAGIAQVAVVRRAGPDGDRLVAYLQGTGADRPSNAELRSTLRATLPEAMIPGAVVWLDRLPWTSTGKIDRAALPDPDAMGSATSDQPAPMTDDLEAHLTTIWEAVFGRSGIRRDDDFFDLGGHSLMAARIFDRIWKETGQQVPLSALLEDPTIASLAARIRSGRDRERDHVIVLKSSGSRPPLFVVPGTGSHVLYLRNLAAHVGGEQPVYALHAPPSPRGGPRDRAVPAIARRHVAALRRIQAHGPYHVVGFSFGGVVAYEIAQQLAALGEPVAFLGLIDSRHPAEGIPAPGFHPRFVPRRLANQARILRRLGPRVGLRYLAARAALARDRTLIAARSALAARSPTLRELVGLDPITGVEQAWQAADAEAIARYHARPYPGRITFLWPEHSQRPPEVFDTRRGWAALARDGFDVRPIPGAHLTVLIEPLAAITTATLVDAIEQSAASVPGAVATGAPAQPPAQPPKQLAVSG